MKSRSELLVLGAIVLLSAVLSILALDGVPPTTPDSFQYMMIGRNLFAGQGYVDCTGDTVTIWHPLFPLLIGAANRIVQDLIFSGRLVSLIASALTVIPVVSIGSRLFGRSAGIGAGLLFAALPLRMRLSGMVLSESVYLLIVLWAVLLWIKEAQCFNMPRSIGTGALLGCAYLVRPEGLACAAALLALSLPVQKWWPVPRLRAVVLSIAALAVVMAPWIIFVHAHTGRWTLTDKMRTSPGSFRAMSKGIPCADQFYLKETEDRQDWSYTSESLPDFAVRFARNAREELGALQTIVGTTLFACILLGLGLEIYRANATLKRSVPALLVAGAPLLYLPAFFPEPRLVFTACVPALLMGSWLLVTRFRAPWGERASTPWTRLTQYVAFGVVLAGMLHQDKLIARLPATAPASSVVAGWLRRSVPPRSKIMSGSLELSFRSGNTWLPLANNDMPRLLRYAHNRNADFLLLNQDDMRRHPEWRIQLDSLEAASSVSKTSERRGRHGERFLLYRICRPDKERS